MATRRHVLFLLIGATGSALAGKAGGAAAAPVVEVLAMGHWPVQNALKPVRDLLAQYQGRLRVVDMDIEGAEGEKRLKAVGLKGHIPIAILIDGSKSFKRSDGKTVEFVNFPATSSNPMGLNGTWSVADFEAALRAALGEKAQ
jgi:hypothetical protein